TPERNHECLGVLELSAERTRSREHQYPTGTAARDGEAIDIQELTGGCVDPVADISLIVATAEEHVIGPMLSIRPARTNRPVVLHDHTDRPGIRRPDIPARERDVERAQPVQPGDRESGAGRSGDDDLPVGLEGQAANRVDACPERYPSHSPCPEGGIEVALACP